MNEFPDILIKQLETDIEKYDKIFLIDNAHELAVRFCHAKALKDTTDTILILLNNPSMRLADMTLNDNIVLRYVSAEEFFLLDRLYHMYDFSDKFYIISRENMYGNIFNLVDCGLLTDEQAYEAILK